DYCVPHRSLRRFRAVSTGLEASHVSPLVRTVRPFVGWPVHAVSQCDDAVSWRGVRIVDCRPTTPRSGTARRTCLMMTIEFWIASAVLMVSVVAFVVQPLRWSRRATDVVSSADANLAVYRRQLAELESDRRRGLVSDDLVAREREEIEQRVLADLPVQTS